MNHPQFRFGPTRGLPSLLRAGFVVIACLGSGVLGGCVVYEPYPGYYVTSNFDRAWNAAVGGAQDVGIQIASAERENGLIRGTRGEINVLVSVVRQADGSVRVQFDAKGPTQNDPGLADRFSQAYDRRMGR
ncbi:MAG TPA: hypothetical protein VJQ51_13615 [Burkholderiales bacterium]|nr:hypothetical protein [Burkholderiales bacterium]